MSRLLPDRVEREDIPEYGWFSIRELIVNAICHRDYSDQGSKIIIKMFLDHIEYYNPGGLPRWITPENIINKQYSRNKTIAKVLSKVRYIEELGEGWDKITKEHKEHALNPNLPEIDANSHTFRVTLFSTKKKFERAEKERKMLWERLNERQRKAIRYIQEHNRITNKEYRSLFSVVKDTAIRDLKDLMDKGIINQRGQGRATHYVMLKKVSKSSDKSVDKSVD